MYFGSLPSLRWFDFHRFVKIITKRVQCNMYIHASRRVHMLGRVFCSWFSLLLLICLVIRMTTFSFHLLVFLERSLLQKLGGYIDVIVLLLFPCPPLPKTRKKSRSAKYFHIPLRQGSSSQLLFSLYKGKLSHKSIEHWVRGQETMSTVAQCYQIFLITSFQSLVVHRLFCNTSKHGGNHAVACTFNFHSALLLHCFNTFLYHRDNYHFTRLTRAPRVIVKFKMKVDIYVSPVCLSA